MEGIQILEELFDRKLMRILQIFLTNREKQFYLQEMSTLSEVPIATTSRILNKLAKLKILKIIKVSKFKIYQLDNNDNTKYLSKIFKKDVQILDLFVDSLKHQPGIQSIILHGEEKKDRANILLIGEEIDASNLKEAVGNIKTNHSFTISALTLTREQYEQMSQMGLYSGKKRSLYER